MKILNSVLGNRGAGALSLGALRDRFIKRPLCIKLGNNEYSFASVAAFEFTAAGRTAIPLEKFTDMIRMPAAELRHEANGIRQVERNFIEVLEKCLERPESCGAFIRELGVKSYSKDHEWRDIMNALNDLGPQFDDYKKVALVKYLQYLGSRQEILNWLYQAHTSKSVVDEDEMLETHAAETRGIGTKETVIFDLMQIDDSHRFVNPFERLPRGETVVLRLPEGASVEILLSKHRFKLVAGEDYLLLDDAGHQYPVTDGRNIVGRHVGNQIHIDNNYRSVSREHLILELTEDRKLRVTDLSSHGTFVPPEFVETVH